MSRHYDLLIRYALIIGGACRPAAQATLACVANFEAPTHVARGIDSAIVKGVPAWREGSSTSERPGRLPRLRGGGASADGRSMCGSGDST